MPKQRGHTAMKACCFANPIVCKDDYGNLVWSGGYFCASRKPCTTKYAVPGSYHCPLARGAQ
jgi:hypothetical protein